MSYKEWNDDRLKGKWYQDRIKKHGSWENYLKFVSEKNRAGGLAGKGSKKPGAGRFKKGELETKLNSKKGHRVRYGRTE